MQLWMARTPECPVSSIPALPRSDCSGTLGLTLAIHDDTPRAQGLSSCTIECEELRASCVIGWAGGPAHESVGARERDTTGGGVIVLADDGGAR